MIILRENESTQIFFTNLEIGNGPMVESSRKGEGEVLNEGSDLRGMDSRAQAEKI